jgi:hypothetical protein
MPARGGRPFVTKLVTKELQRFGTGKLRRYEAALAEACGAAPPPYGEAWYGDRYRSWAVDGAWMAQSLVANASKEGDGARKLWSLSGRTGDRRVAELVRQHAIDEARHAHFYIALLELAFPGAANKEALVRLHKLSPGYTSKDRPKRRRVASDASVLDEIIQMNIGEIRTLIHQKLMRPVLALHCPQAARNRLSRLLDGLSADEVKHIDYTARLIDTAATDRPDFVRETFRARLAEFNAITIGEVGSGQYD